MGEFRELVHLMEAIYDAVLDSARWADVLAKVADFVGGQAGGIVLKDSAGALITTYCHFGIECRYSHLYAETYWELDPAGMLFAYDVEQVSSIADLVPYEEFRKGRFYHEWMRPQGWADAAHAVLEKSATHCLYLCIIRSEASGVVDAEMRRRMGLVVPHVRRAVRIGRAIDLKQAEVTKFVDILDGLSVSILLIDAGGRVVHANVAGHGMLRAGDFLRTAGGRLVADDAQIEQALREAFVAADNGDAALGIKSITVPLTARNGERYIGHVLPLTSRERRRGSMACATVAALFVRKAQMDAASPAKGMAKTYNLTPTELRVLLAIIEVGGVPDVAVALGVAESTVKTHLGRLFEKTDTRRQVDLVKLVAGFSNPLLQ
jgi:DNA-binding CsgD family transcriptional regulator